MKFLFKKLLQTIPFSAYLYYVAMVQLTLQEWVSVEFVELDIYV